MEPAAVALFDPEEWVHPDPDASAKPDAPSKPEADPDDVPVTMRSLSDCEAMTTFETIFWGFYTSGPRP